MKQILISLLIIMGISAETPTLSFDIIREIDHDSDAFTQGLLFRDGSLWESTGTPGGGTRIRQLDTITGEEVKTTSPNNSYFGEGLALDGRFFYQLSWKQEQVHLFEYPSLEEITTIPYRGEGWGLTRNCHGQFLQSNGSDTITVRNEHFQPESSFTVSMDGSPLNNINELEWADSLLYANVWYSDSIVQINPANGEVTGVIDLSGIRQVTGALASEQVVNGIAWECDNRFWVTGKFWEKIYLIDLDQ